MKEEWRDVVGYEGRYMVSNTGKVWGFYRNREMKLSHYNKKHNYPYVSLTDDFGRVKKRKVHHLVLEAFVGPRPEGTEACHNDGVCTNNNLNNLRWDTRKSNMNDKRSHGTHIFGKDAPMASLDDETAVEIHRKASEGRSAYSLSKEYGVEKSTILGILSGATWRHLELPPIDFFWRPFRSKDHYLRAKDFVSRVELGETIAQVARDFGVDPKNAYRDYRRAVANLKTIERDV